MVDRCGARAHPPCKAVTSTKAAYAGIAVRKSDEFALVFFFASFLAFPRCAQDEPYVLQHSKEAELAL